MDRPLCNPIQTLPNEWWDTKTPLNDCNAPGRKVYDKVADKVVEIDAGEKPQPRANEETMVGSGFWAQDGTHVVTNTHVAMMGVYLEVVDAQGKRHKAQIEKLNDLDDIAVLKVDDIQPDANRAVSLKVATGLQSGDSILGFGHADGSPDVILSQGSYRENGKFEPLLLKVNQDLTNDVKPIVAMEKSSDKHLAADAKTFLEGERIHGRINFHHGDSGGLVVTPNLDLVGMAAFRMNQAHGLMIPASKIVDTLNKPESKFDFKYQTDTDGNHKLISVDRKDGSAEPPIYLHLPKPSQQASIMPILPWLTENSFGQYGATIWSFAPYPFSWRHKQTQQPKF